MKTKKGNVGLGTIAMMIALVASVTAYNLSNDKVSYVVVNAHLDTQWQWDLQTTIESFLPNTSYRNFDLFEEHPKYVFNFEGAYRYKLIKEYYPEEYSLLKGYIAKGNWAPIGAFVDACDVIIPSPESLVRQNLYGNGFFRDEFGKKSIDIFLPDCFGFGYALPTIAVHCGLKGFSTQKFDLWGGFRPTPFSIGRWQGVDGSILVAALKPGPYSDLQWDIRRPDGDALQKSSGVWATYDYFGVGDQGGGNEDGAVSGLINRIADNENQDVKVVLAPADQIFKDLTPNLVAKLPLYDGELVMQTHGTGSYTAHADLKMRNHSFETLAYAGELASVTSEITTKKTYPTSALKNAWFRVLAGQMHDIVTGTSIPDAYSKYSIPQLDSSLSEITSILSNANIDVASSLDTRTQDPMATSVVVYNSLPSQREDLASVAITFSGTVPAHVRVFNGDGVEVPSQKNVVVGQTMLVVFMASVVASGYSAYEIRPSTTPCPIATGVIASTTSMENGRYRVAIDGNGDISSIVDKVNGNRELLDKPSRLEMRNNNSERWPSWELMYKDVSSTPREYVDESVQVTVVENGPARASIQVSRTKNGSSFTQYYRLNADTSCYVEVANEINWNTPATMLKVGFPLKASNTNATFDLGVGVIARPNMTASLYEVPAQQWADITNIDNSFGVSILTDYKRGWDKFNDNTLHLTLIHTPSGTAFGYYGDRFQHRFSYGIYGHAGTWDKGNVVWQGLRFNQPLRVKKDTQSIGTGKKSFSLVTIDKSKIALMALKKAESGNEYIVRIREVAGNAQSYPVTITFPDIPALHSVRELNGFEEDSVVLPSNVHSSGNTITLSVKKFQIKTIGFKIGVPAPVASLENFNAKTKQVLRVSQQMQDISHFP